MFLLNHKYKIIISSKDNCPSLRKFVKDNNLIEDVRIFDYAPQKYILSNSDLFITSGGFNSITEINLLWCTYDSVAINSRAKVKMDMK